MYCLARLQAVIHLNVKHFVPGQAEGLGTLIFQKLQRQHAHAHQVAAVNPLEALGDHSPDAQQQRALGSPVA